MEQEQKLHHHHRAVTIIQDMGQDYSVGPQLSTDEFHKPHLDDRTGVGEGE